MMRHHNLSPLRPAMYAHACIIASLYALTFILVITHQARSQKILLGGSFEEYVDLLLLQPSQVS